MELSEKGQEIQKADDILKDPYVLEFLNIPVSYQFLESELEEKLISNLQHFLLELGKGFTFEKRQYRISNGNIGYQLAGSTFLWTWFFIIVFWNASFLLTWSVEK